MVKSKEFLKKSEIIEYLEKSKGSHSLEYVSVSMSGDRVSFVNGNVVVSEILLITDGLRSDGVRHMLPSGISPSNKGLDCDKYWNPQFGDMYKFYPTKKNLGAWLDAISNVLTK